MNERHDRARWVQEGAILVLRCHSGQALARITESSVGMWTWVLAEGGGGWTNTKYAAQLRARKALRARVDDRAVRVQVAVGARADELRGVSEEPYIIEYYEDEPSGPFCAECGQDMAWVDCDACGGEGLSYHDCGDDSCPCLDPEPNVSCGQCAGRGGWWWCDSRKCYEKRRRGKK